MNTESIETSLDYHFSDVSWLVQALTHPSCKAQRSAALQYERLEFLGDAVLELVVSHELMIRYPKADEGLLTKLRASIVSRQHLGGLCRHLGWCEEMRMDDHIIARGERELLSTQANTFESVIGAVLMDSNYKMARQVSLRLLGESLAQVTHIQEESNPKGTLLETLQALRPDPVEYQVEELPPIDKLPYFEARVLWCGQALGCGQGTSKRRAEKEAAKQALERELWKQG